MTDVYFAYGKALLENAIAQNSVLGKEQEGAPPAESMVHKTEICLLVTRFDWWC
jgi:hypothetical protein